MNPKYVAYGRLISTAEPKMSAEQIEAKRAKVRDDLERAALTLELIDARRRLLGDKVDREWERSVIDGAIRDIDPSPAGALSFSAMYERLFGGGL